MPVRLVGQAAEDRKASLERLRDETFRAGLGTAYIDAELRELLAHPSPAPSALVALQNAKKALAASERRHEAALAKVTLFGERLTRLQGDLTCARTAAANAERALSTAKAAELAAARAVTLEAENAATTLSAPRVPVVSTAQQVERVKENVASLRQVLDKAGDRVGLLKPTLSTEWDAYVASDVSPKLSQTDCMFERIRTSLTDELLAPAREVCDQTLRLVQPAGAAVPQRTPWADVSALAAGSGKEEEEEEQQRQRQQQQHQ